MFKGILALFCISLLLVPAFVQAQDDPMVVGFQFRPIFKNKYFNSGTQELTVNKVKFTITPTLGYSYGMVVRTPLANKFSLEIGINYFKRNYSFGVEDLDSVFSTSANFSVIEYEIPVSALVHVQLGDDFYMNTSAGISLNMFKRSEVEYVDNISYGFDRKSWMNLALNANVGFEYRTEYSGYFYLGSSYQLPFSKVIVMSGEYYRNKGSEQIITEMNLGFFTLDLKYFMPSREY